MNDTPRTDAEEKALGNWSAMHSGCLSLSRTLERELAAALTENGKVMREAVLRLRTEVNCRVEHGAESGGHLEYVQKELDAILDIADMNKETRP